MNQEVFLDFLRREASFASMIDDVGETEAFVDGENFVVVAASRHDERVWAKLVLSPAAVSRFLPPV